MSYYIISYYIILLLYDSALHCRHTCNVHELCAELDGGLVRLLGLRPGREGLGGLISATIVYVYIYIYIERERQTNIYIYIYVHTVV